MLPDPFFHQESETVRFWVRTEGDQFVGASISRQTLHYRFRAEMSEEAALASYAAHRDEIEAAVIRRLAAGSLEPVMLREADVARR